MLEIRKVQDKKELKQFVRFNYEMYKDCPYAVPDFLEDTLKTFDKKKNAAFDFCEAEWFMAFRDGKMVGKVVAIINNKANTHWNTKFVRFGWIDFIDDEEVSRALIDAVEKWGKERGMESIQGPMGFTDMDPEAMLYEGYEMMGNMSTIYNYPYYNTHMEKLGFQEDAKWVERRVIVPCEGHEAQSEKYDRVAELVKKRYGFRLRKIKNRAELKEGNYITKVFNIINRCYENLYGYSQMTERQVNQLANTYLQYLDLRLLTIVENKEGEPIGVGICMGSVSEAIRKAKAKLFPLGWYYMIKGLFFNRSETVDMLLYGILPEYRDTGAVSLIFQDSIKVAQKMGFKYADCMPMLETNTKAQAAWKLFEHEITKKRHVWCRRIKN